MKEKSSGGPEQPARRDFLANVAMTGGLVVSLGVAAVYGVSYLVPKKKVASYIDVLVSNMAELLPGTAREFTDLSGRKGILVNNGGNVKAFSKMCTHLGCEVEWKERDKQFYCPCHEGYFNAEGKNISGPPPRPLDEFTVTVKDDNVFVALEEV
jgi:cytochrome b6-f complex iron-sulfur subunit